jgi:hypothetical protein
MVATVVSIPSSIIGGLLVGLATNVHMFTYQNAEDPQRGLISVLNGKKSSTGHTMRFLISLFVCGLIMGTLVVPDYFQPEKINFYSDTFYDYIRSGVCYGVGAAWSGGCFQYGVYHIPSYLRKCSFIKL